MIISYFISATWIQETQLSGDFYAQNADALAPGDLAPFYPRYGHTLNVLSKKYYTNINTDLMILCGGYSPVPSNDVWISPDGQTWFYTGTYYVLTWYLLRGNFFLCRTLHFS